MASISAENRIVTNFQKMNFMSLAFVSFCIFLQISLLHIFSNILQRGKDQTTTISKSISPKKRKGRFEREENRRGLVAFFTIRIAAGLITFGGNSKFSRSFFLSSLSLFTLPVLFFTRLSVTILLKISKLLEKYTKYSHEIL